MAITAELGRGQQSTSGNSSAYATQVPPSAEGPMSSTRESLSRLEQCCSADNGDEGRFAAILARVKQHVKEAEQLALMHTMASSSIADDACQHSMLDDLLQAAEMAEEVEFKNSFELLGESRNCVQSSAHCAASNVEVDSRRPGTFSFSPDPSDARNCGTSEIYKFEVQPEIRGAQYESAKRELLSRPELLARPDLSLKDLASIAARRDDMSEDRFGYSQSQISRVSDTDDSFAKQDDSFEKATPTESILLEDTACDRLGKTDDMAAGGRSALLRPGYAASTKGKSESFQPTDVCSSTADTARSPGSCVTEAPARPDDVLAALLAQAYSSGETIGNNPAQAAQINSRVHAKYNDTWYLGTIVQMPAMDELGRYAIQCDCDKEGVLLYTTFVELVDPATHTNQAAVSDDAPIHRPTDQIALLEQRLEDLERQMAFDVQEVTSLKASCPSRPKVGAQNSASVPSVGSDSAGRTKKQIVTRNAGVPSMPSPVRAPAVLQPTPVTPPPTTEAMKPSTSMPSHERTAVHRQAEARRTPTDNAGPTRKVGEAARKEASSTAAAQRGEAAREAAARDLAAMKEAAATLSASAAACKAAVSSSFLPEFSEELPPTRDLDPAPLTSWAEDAYSQVVGLGGLDSRQPRSTPVVQSHPVAKKDAFSAATDPADSVSTAISSSPALKSASSWRCVASSPDSVSFRVSSPATPTFPASQRPTQGESIASSSSPATVGSFRLVKPSSECSEAKDANGLDTLFEKAPEEWDEKDVCSWMSSLASVPKDLLEFIEAQAINGLVLLSLTDDDLETIPLQKFGHRRLLLLAAKQLRARISSTKSNSCETKSSDAAVTKSGTSASADIDVDQAHERAPPALQNTTPLRSASPSRATPSRAPEPIRDFPSRKGAVDSSALDASRKTVSAISLASPKLSSTTRTSALTRTNSSPSALTRTNSSGSSFVCNPLLHAPRRCSPERTTASPLLQRAASPDGRSASPVRQSRAVVSTRAVGSSGSLPSVSDSNLTGSGATRGSFRMSPSASSRRVGAAAVARQSPQSRPRSPPRARGHWTQNGPARVASSSTVGKRGAPSFATP